MAGYPQPGMVPGPIEYKRKYELWLLILLLILCWPGAIVYYFICPVVPVQTYYTPVVNYPQQPQWAPATPQTNVGPGGTVAPAPQVATQNACPRCGRPLTWVGQYQRWYCWNERQYV